MSGLKDIEKTAALSKLVRTATKYFNASPKDKYSTSTLNMFLSKNNAIPSDRQCNIVMKTGRFPGLELWRKRCDAATADLRRFYDKHCAFVVSLADYEEKRIGYGMSEMFSTDSGMIYYFPFDEFDDVFICSHALDRMEERMPKHNMSSNYMYASKSCACDLSDMLRECIAAGELEYFIVGPSLFNIKIGKYGIIAISAKGDGDAFLIKTFLSSDMDKTPDPDWLCFSFKHNNFHSCLVHAYEKSKEVK